MCSFLLKKETLNTNDTLNSILFLRRSKSGEEEIPSMTRWRPGVREENQHQQKNLSDPPSAEYHEAKQKENIHLVIIFPKNTPNQRVFRVQSMSHWMERNPAKTASGHWLDTPETEPTQVLVLKTSWLSTGPGTLCWTSAGFALCEPASVPAFPSPRALHKN